MKKTLLFLATGLLSLMATTVNAQQNNVNPIPSDASETPYWIDMMQDPEANFFQTQQAFEQYWENRPVERGAGYKPFKRWEYRMQFKVDETGKKPSVNEVVKSLAARAHKSLSGDWRPLGPNFDYTTNYGDFPGVGRVNTIVFDPADPDVVYIGSPAGGLWRSTDYGGNWTPLTDALPTLGVSAVVVDYTNTNIIYIGTGDRDANDSPGLGVWKSTDGGATWLASNVGIETLTVNTMLIDPIDPNILIAGTNLGVYRSDDAGATWTLGSLSISFKDLKFHPTDHNIVYGCHGRIYRSDDNGVSFSQITGLPLANRIVLAVSPATPDVVYAMYANQRPILGFYVSIDAGLSFDRVMDEPNILGYQTDGSDASGGQSWYDLALAASPTNADEVWSAGIHVWKSGDGGVNWLHETNGVHVDMHSLAFSPHTNDLWLGNDGGAYLRKDGEPNWTDVSQNLFVGQLYKLGQSMQDVNKCMGGFQDNGTGLFDGDSWARILGGDGMECMYDETDDTYAYASLYYGAIYRKIGTAGFKKFAGNNVNGINEEGAWVTPYTVDAFDGTTMFTGFKNVWRTRNLKTSDHNDIVWEKISSNNLGNSGDNFSVVAYSPLDSSLFFAVKGSNLYRTANALDSANLVSWSTITSFPVGGSITDIEFHPTDTNVVYMSRGSDALVSADRGLTWTLLGTGLPTVAANCIAYDKTSNDGVYVGTEIGVYFKDASMTDFIVFSQGLPAALDVREINIFPGNGTDAKRVRCATYGRGLWESDAYDSNTLYYPPTAIINSQNNQFQQYGEFTLDLHFYENLSVQTVSGFDITDIETSSNVTLSDFTGTTDAFTVTVTPNAFGEVWITVPADAATDLNGIDNLAADTFRIMYSNIATELGIDGPGGVGDSTTLALWLKAAFNGSDTQGGTLAAADGDPVGYWTDLSGHNAVALQLDPTFMPLLRLDTGGINGHPALEFTPMGGDSGRFITADQIAAGKNFSVFTVTQSSTERFNDHGWLASSRDRDGFILHASRNTNAFYAHVRDADNRTANGWTTTMGEISEPHIYGIIYSENNLGGNIHTIADKQDNERIVTNLTRAATDSIDIQFGKDRDDRPGAGKMAETFMYNIDLNNAQLRIVSNYLAAQYSIDLQDESLYAHGSTNGNEVAGIGKESYFDEHLDARGTGIVRMYGASGLDDGEYLLWGHDSAKVSTWSSVTQVEGLSQLDRKWRIDKTGSITTVNVEIESAQLATSSDLYGLLVTPTGDVTEGGYIHALSVGNGTLNARVDFSDDAHVAIVSGSQKVFDNFNAEYDAFTLVIYPNPADGNFFVEITNTDVVQGRLTVHNSIGQLVDDRTIDTGKRYIFNASEYGAGTYFVRYEGNEQNIVKKVVVY